LITVAYAKTLACPFRYAPSVVIEEAVDGGVDDNSSSYLQVSSLIKHYETHGKMIAVAEINRVEGGDPYDKTMCQPDGANPCVFWRNDSDNTSGSAVDSGFCSLMDDNRQRITASMPDDANMKNQSCVFAKAITIYRRDWTDTNSMLSGKTVAAVGSNQDDTGKPHPDCKCITKKCMGFMSRVADKGSCMAGDKNMQRR
jgi:hypothetical protein